MKKVFGAIAACIIILLLTCSIAFADDTRTSGLYTYTIKGNGTITIVDFDWKNNSGDIYIPTMLDGYNLTGIGDRAFSGNSGSSPVTVNIPNTVTSIGNFAFENANISFINIPQTVTFIGANPFMNCLSLMQISVDPSNTTFASIDGVLYHKGKKALISYPLAMKKAKIPSGIVEISDYACVGITDWYSSFFPDTLEKIGDHAFENATIYAGQYFVPESVREIGKYSFSNANCIVTQTIQTTSKDGMTWSKEDGGFGKIKQTKLDFEDLDKRLGYIYGVEFEQLKLLGTQVQSLGIGAFSGLKISRLHKGNSYYQQADILLVYIGEIPSTGEKSNLAIIPEKAFEGMTVSTKASFNNYSGYPEGMLLYPPQVLTYIGEKAFSGVKTIRLIDNRIVKIGSNAFSGSVLDGTMAVDDCEEYGFAKINSDFSKWKMSDLTISLNCSAIPDHAFSGSMLSLKVENRLDSVGDYAFFNSAVTQSTKGYAKLGAHAFDGANLPSALEIPNFLSEIGECAFANNPNLLELTLPESVSLIGDNAFDKTIIKLTVSKGSYAEFWAQENGYSYKYADGGEDSLDWLNN